MTKEEEVKQQELLEEEKRLAEWDARLKEDLAELKKAKQVYALNKKAFEIEAGIYQSPWQRFLSFFAKKETEDTFVEITDTQGMAVEEEEEDESVFPMEEENEFVFPMEPVEAEEIHSVDI